MTCPISDAFFASCSAMRRGERRGRASFVDDEIRHRDDQVLTHLLDLDDGEDLLQLAAVGEVYDAPFEQVVAVQLVQHDERVGRVYVGDLEPDLLIY